MESKTKYDDDDDNDDDDVVVADNKKKMSSRVTFYQRWKLLLGTWASYVFGFGTKLM